MKLVHLYIKKKIPEDIKHFFLWVQVAKQKSLSSEYVEALVDLKRFKTVTQYFPIRGYLYQVTKTLL